jgi:hypothetical protein
MIRSSPRTRFGDTWNARSLAHLGSALPGSPENRYHPRQLALHRGNVGIYEYTTQAPVGVANNYRWHCRRRHCLGTRRRTDLSANSLFNRRGRRPGPPRQPNSGAREVFDVGSAHQSDHPIVAGAIGGNVAGTAGGKTVDLGLALNSIVGAIGGGAGGQILSALIPALAGAANNVDIGALIGQVAGGGVAGAILTAIVGVVKNKMTT